MKIILNAAAVLSLLASSAFAMEGYNINDKMMQMKRDKMLKDENLPSLTTTVYPVPSGDSVAVTTNH